MSSRVSKWKNRNELPAIEKLDLRFDMDLLLEAYHEFSEKRNWDGLGAEYASLCETHTRLPKMFFKKEELESAESICDLDFEQLSYQQLSLTEWDPDYSLDERDEMSGSSWDTRVAKRDPQADERWYRKTIEGLPDYLKYVIEEVGKGKAHRSRFAKLKAGSSVSPHIDYDTTYGIRIHVPILTNSKCSNGGVDKGGNEVNVHFPADGSTWFVNPGVKHWANNHGDSDRIHLIISVDSHNLLEHHYNLNV